MKTFLYELTVIAGAVKNHGISLKKFPVRISKQNFIPLNVSDEERASGCQTLLFRVPKEALNVIKKGHTFDTADRIMRRVYLDNNKPETLNKFKRLMVAQVRETYNEMRDAIHITEETLQTIEEQVE